MPASRSHEQLGTVGQAEPDGRAQGEPLGYDKGKRPNPKAATGRDMLVREYYLESRVHSVAHAKIASGAHEAKLWLTIIAGILAGLSGGTWTANLAKVGLDSRTIQWLAAMAAIVSAILLIINAAARWDETVKDHNQYKMRWDGITGVVTNVLLDGELTHSMKAKVEALRAKALDDEKMSSWRLHRAQTWLKKSRPNQQRLIDGVTF